MSQKRLTYHGPGHVLAAPGFTLERGESALLGEHLAAELVRRNPHLQLVVADCDTSEPPRTGPGSGKQAWLDYAATLGIPTDGLTRDELIAAGTAAADTSAPDGDSDQPEAHEGDGHTIHDQKE